MYLSKQPLSGGKAAECDEGLSEEGQRGAMAIPVNGVASVLVLFLENPDFSKDHSGAQHSEAQERREAPVLVLPEGPYCEAPSSPHTATGSD